MSENQKIFKNSLVLYCRLFLISITSIFTSRFVLQSLGASDFGLYSVVGGIVVMATVLNNVMVSTSFRYIAVEIGRSNGREINKVFNISLVINTCLALVGVVVAETVGVYYIINHLNLPAGRLGDALFVFHCSVLATVTLMLSMPYQGLITAHEKFSARSAIEILHVLLKLVAAIALLYFLGNRIRLYAVCILGAALLQTSLYVAYCKRHYASAVRWSFQLDGQKYKEMLGFSGWVMLGAGASVGQTQGTALLMNLFFGTVLNASLGIANQVQATVLMFAQNLSHAAIPQITKSYSNGNEGRTSELLSYVSKYSFFLMLLPALPILLETDFILKMWLKAVPQYTGVFCKFMIATALVGTVAAGVPATVQASGNIKYFQIVVSVTSLLTLPVSYVLFTFGFPAPSILAVYLATTCLNIIAQLVLLHVILKFDVRGYVKNSFSRIASVVIFVSPLFFMTILFQESWTRFVIFAFGAIAWTLAAVYLVGIDSREREYLASTIRHIRLRRAATTVVSEKV